jgi:hypothetical protein
MDKIEQEIRGIWFKDHVATLTTHGDLQVLDWSNPETICYSCRYVFDGYKMYISGDIGSAVFDLTWKADVHSFNKVSIGYFTEKLAAFSDPKRDFSSEKAVKRLRERLKDIKYEGIEYDHEAMRELFEHARNSREQWEWVEAVHEHEDLISKLDRDYWEWIYTCGDEIPTRVYAYLIGLKMASEQLWKEQPSEKLAMDFIPLPKQGPGYELTVPVTLKFSSVVRDTSYVCKKILAALVSWVEDGPGFISDDDDSYTSTMCFIVDELKMTTEQLQSNQCDSNKDVKEEEGVA